MEQEVGIELEIGTRLVVTQQLFLYQIDENKLIRWFSPGLHIYPSPDSILKVVDTVADDTPNKSYVVVKENDERNNRYYFSHAHLVDVSVLV